jgi:hypothetical protein
MVQWMAQRKQSKLDRLECYEVLNGLTSAFPINSYLEIGVREGASLISVLAKEKEAAKFAFECLADGQNQLHPSIIEHIDEYFTLINRDIQIYLFDNWSYFNNKGAHERIQNLLTCGFKTGNYHIFDGDSKVTVPAFFETHKEKIDLAFIDGDHTREGATADLLNVWEHAKIIVFHDLFHPQYNFLESLFIDFCRAHSLPYFIVGRGGHPILGTGVAFNLW